MSKTTDEILQQMLGLPEDERLRILGALTALHGHHSPIEGLNQPSTVLEVHSEFENVKNWYEGLGPSEIPYVRLQHIDSALEQVEDPEASTYLQQRRKELLDDQPSLAVRLSVTKIATEQPWLIVGAFVGACLAAATFARWGWRLWF